MIHTGLYYRVRAECNVYESHDDSVTSAMKRGLESTINSISNFPVNSKWSGAGGRVYIFQRSRMNNVVRLAAVVTRVTVFYLA